MYRSQKGFTLLEIIVVVVIMGVLMSLALPRYFETVEYSRSIEALLNIGAIRQSLERCYVKKNTYESCTLDKLDLENPNTAPNAHFTYEITNIKKKTYDIRATRNLNNGGNGEDYIAISLTNNDIIRIATGAFKSLSDE